MKKAITVVIVIIGLLILIGCNNKEEPINDKIAPLIIIETEHQVLVINRNQGVDLDKELRKGVTAIDNIDGDVTHNIKIDFTDVDISKPGLYKVYLTVSDKAGNVSDFSIKTVSVLETYSILPKYNIHLEIIQGEADKPAEQEIFKGAYYHKVVSSRDTWLGIEGVITLPEVKIRRYRGPFNEKLNIDPSVKNLDNPSIYMGGNATYESDVGLSLSNTILGNGKISEGSFAFRPFWRYITSSNSKNKDIGGYDLENGRRYTVQGNHNETNMAANWHFSDTQYYYLPGDKLRMIVYSPEANRLQLQIEVIEKSTLEHSLNVRKDNRWKDPENFISPVFESQGHGSTSAEFKRVNAIDQSGNEGSEAIKTDTSISNAVWENVYLYRKINGKKVRVPFIERRLSSLSAPESMFFTTTVINATTGGQSISIHPGNK